MSRSRVGLAKEIIDALVTFSRLFLVIKACAYSRDHTAESKKEALKLSLQIYSDMKSEGDVEPDAVTYASLIKACNFLMEPSDNMKVKTIVRLFRRCCEEGKVSQFVLKELQASLSADEIRVAMGSDTLYVGDVGSIPKQWRRNVLNTGRNSKC